MIITDFSGHCPICGALLEMTTSSPLVVSCPTGHYRLSLTTGSTTGTSMVPLQKSVVEVPKVFQDAFDDEEALEP